MLNWGIPGQIDGKKGRRYPASAGGARQGEALSFSQGADTYFKAKGYERLSERRVREAIATGADVLAVSCPYEVSRFEDALKVLGYDKRMIVRDVTELLAEAMEE